MTANNHVLSQLTPKQREVLALVADNRTSKEIASLLGISESAVNQRIELVRSRMGGLPRGELARLYRQLNSENSSDLAELSETWQKIQVPEPSFSGTLNSAESVSPLSAVGSHRRLALKGDGSQLAALLFRADNTWLWRRRGATAFVRLLAIAAIGACALAFGPEIPHAWAQFDY